MSSRAVAHLDVGRVAQRRKKVEFWRHFAHTLQDCVRLPHARPDDVDDAMPKHPELRACNDLRSTGRWDYRFFGVGVRYGCHDRSWSSLCAAG
jgi:hypothetical protein